MVIMKKSSEGGYARQDQPRSGKRVGEKKMMITDYGDWPSVRALFLGVATVQVSSVSTARNKRFAWKRIEKKDNCFHVSRIPQ
jgi:hypothetical protein